MFSRSIGCDRVLAAQKTRSSGMLAFTILCVGQVFSLLGTAMSGFALAIWAWQKTCCQTMMQSLQCPQMQKIALDLCFLSPFWLMV